MNDDIASVSAVTPGELGVRVGLLERRDIDIERQVNAIRDTMATRADVASLSTQIQQLAQAQQAALRPNYGLLIGVVGIGLTFLGMIGAFAYWPINTGLVDTKTALVALTEKMVPRAEHDFRQAAIDRRFDEVVRTQRDTRRDLDEIERNYVQQQRVLRDEEAMEKLRDRGTENTERVAKLERARDDDIKSFDGMRSRIADELRDLSIRVLTRPEHIDLQNQVKALNDRLGELRAEVGGTYGPRDELKRIQDEIGEIRHQLDAMESRH
jgi:hypothetical protein